MDVMAVCHHTPNTFCRQQHCASADLGCLCQIFSLVTASQTEQRIRQTSRCTHTPRSPIYLHHVFASAPLSKVFIQLASTLHGVLLYLLVFYWVILSKKPRCCCPDMLFDYLWPASRFDWLTRLLFLCMHFSPSWQLVLHLPYSLKCRRTSVIASCNALKATATNICLLPLIGSQAMQPKRNHSMLMQTYFLSTNHTHHFALHPSKWVTACSSSKIKLKMHAVVFFSFYAVRKILYVEPIILNKLQLKQFI